MANYSDLSDEDIDKLVALGEIQDKQAFLNNQYNMVQGLRNQPLDTLTEGRRVSTAATPLGLLGQLGTKVLQGQQLNSLSQQRQQMYDQQLAGRKAYFQMLRNGAGSPASAPGLLMPVMDSGQT